MIFLRKKGIIYSMKKSTTWTLVIIVIVLIIVAWYAFSEANAPMTGQSGTATVSSTTTQVATVDYFCASGTIAAAYASTSVNLAFSDGRTLILPQTMSGSGIRYEIGSGTAQDMVFASEGNDATFMENNKTTYDDCVAGTEIPSTSGMATYTDASNLFSITYPTQFTLSGGGGGYSTSWRTEATSSGMELAVVTIPSSFQPKTNFVGAQFTFGTSVDAAAVSGCLADANGEPVKSSTTTINGVPFTELSYGDVGAGNLYDITSYRIVHNNQCYAAEYVVHSSELGNYPPSAGITAFNSSTVQSLLDGIARSVRFLQ
jgi:membrane-bound inhibitor of C-type lysozyme